MPRDWTFSRERAATALLIVLSIVIGVGLFVAGALWRARATLP
jgi:hypothetical protein